VLINTHEHLQSRREIPVLLRLMDICQIEKTVLLGSSAFTLTSDYRLGFTGYKENNWELIETARKYPDRFEAWPTLNPLDPANADKLRFYHDQGAAGLKLYLGHGFVAPESSDYIFGPIAMDDPRMDEIYEYCAVHYLPVCLHINPGPSTLGFADEFVAVLKRHPQLSVNAPHWILSSGKSSRLSELLDVFSNLYTDVSFGVDQFLKAGLRRISRNTSSIRKIIDKHRDRFMFGTDFVVTRCSYKSAEWMQVRVQAYLSMLSLYQYETDLLPGEILNGLNLPSEVLAGIESENFFRLRSPKQSCVCSRSVDWSRFGYPRHSRRPGERVRPSAGLQFCCT
jgi:predicted TIM-barrel fold metal-dependent hydrolase